MTEEIGKQNKTKQNDDQDKKKTRSQMNIQMSMQNNTRINEFRKTKSVQIELDEK